ncbi:MAG: hypothetical protein VX111_16710, partial [Planctomycetota bacterium]|nr:hypothetical protein [Planctomycetota bacterium]
NSKEPSRSGRAPEIHQNEEQLTFQFASMKGPFFRNIKPHDDTESGLKVLQRANAFPKKIQGTMRLEQDPEHDQKTNGPATDDR